MGNKKGLYTGIIILLVLIGGIWWLSGNIDQRQQEGATQLAIKSIGAVEMTDDNPTFDEWGKNFPDYLDMYLTVEKEEPFATEFGGNLAYSKLIRYPQLTLLWAGYPFSLDANEERGHFFIQADQMDTARNNKDFLNAHGFKAFGGQPTACMNCHSGWTPWLIKNVAKGDFVAFNSTKYWTMIKNVPAVNGAAVNSPEHNGLHGGRRMGVTCADCHNPNDMQLRVTRPALINALVNFRGYEADPVLGVKASREEMRTLVCSQCHVEYYFKPTGTKVKVMGESIANDSTKKWYNGTQKTYDEVEYWRDGNEPTEIEVAGLELVFPWSTWKKGEPFRIEMFDDHYDKVRNIFDKDWVHKITNAPMIKIQHPESELFSGGVHAANGVSCADCHMPYIRKGSKKVTQHNITSPLKEINAACKSCHTQSESYLKAQISDIQNSISHDMRTAEYAIVSLIMDTKNLRERLSAMDKFQTDGQADVKKISAEIADVLELQRKASIRADFVGAENSTGFHNPREASRMLLQAVDMARSGQTKLVEIAAKNGITDFTTSDLGFEDIQKFNPGDIRYKVDLNGHKAGDRYYEHENINGNPPAKLLEDDKNIKPYTYTYVDKK
ncbi:MULTISPECIES: ammonia-forming cytochrome c nitrite reductase subunit c552 [unclassified Campylobacter]|uniref:ammonia-forming cytochrome c nitrite reductase subunit c552 n=1 Tax=unclassified Campylobacter TaxID=2593542 RepID=UPI001237AE3F|nr:MULTISPECIES: ammonia-forming cytochrome c nitrite reductase subunit c552 [unclassified Campylobacter]KAA6226443.1 ammonia-forming cytochrome c nitrite reductase subunit c552 [Campylobacter sp. LR185c]KAA6228579.1 ammonia-forming cytochrome c nitrite reductase subunit c552 [Campylobacter sp. LR196d]KAA6229132.1 ammonia-forming cytochrome c nitrite reductase subunit c552 [Campylobacter sp. LR286c]KAA6233923.1 ammonia-forming cytochrome c nitrite reductase subunit c552 [Campylobacter sp. LR291